MAIQNSGKSAELEFQRQARLAGGWVHRFLDRAGFVGLNRNLRGGINYPTQPADFIVAIPNIGMHLAEVKSVSRELKSIPSTLLRPAQAEAIGGCRRGGEHNYVIYLLDMIANRWYIVNPYQDIGKKVADVKSRGFGESLWK